MKSSRRAAKWCRHKWYVVAWAIFGNTHHNPPSHGRHTFARRGQ